MYKKSFNASSQANDFYREGIQLFKERKYTEALVCFRKASSGNNTNAMKAIYMMYKDGIGVKKNDDRASYWLEKHDFTMKKKGKMNSKI